MKKKLSIFLTFVFLMSMIVSCGSSNTVETTKSIVKETNEVESIAETTIVETTDDEKKVLSVQVGPSPETIDPHLNSAIDGANMLIHAYEGLLKMNKKNEIVPGLAESYEKDGLTWTFHLRPNLKWSDGTELNANDFVYSWKRLVSPETAAPYAEIINVVAGFEDANEGDLDALKVSAPDKDTFVVTLASPCVYFDKLASFISVVPVKEDTIVNNGDAWTLKPNTYITDGPYRMKEFTDGEKIVFEKNPYYWDKDNITFDEIIWNLIEDANSSYSAYRQGKIQMIKDVPTEEIESLKDDPEFHVDPIMSTYYLSFNMNKEPFNDKRVREALTLAIDKKYVAETIMQGTYKPATNFVGPGVSDVVEGSSFENVTTEKYGNHFDVDNFESDLEKAKKLLADAGYPNGEGFPHFEYSTNDAGYHKPLAEYLQQCWSELGLDMSINIEEWKTFTANRRVGNFDVARNGWTFDYDDPSNILEILYSTNGNNDGKYNSNDFDELMDEARSTDDVNVHFEKLHEAEQVLLNDSACAPVAYYQDFWLQKSNLKNCWHSPYGYWYFMYGSLE